MSNSKKFKGIPSFESFFNEVTGQNGSKDKNKDKGREAGAEDSLGSPAGVPSPSLASLMRRTSWGKGRLSLSNSFKSLVSPTPDDADNDGVTDHHRRPDTRRRGGGEAKQSFGANGANGGGEANVRGRGKGSDPEALAEAAAAAAAKPRRIKTARQASQSPPLAPRHEPAPPPSPDSPGPRRRRSVSMNSAISDSTQIEDFHHQPPRPSSSKLRHPAAMAAVEPERSLVLLDALSAGGGVFGGEGEGGGQMPVGSSVKRSRHGRHDSSTGIGESGSGSGSIAGSVSGSSTASKHGKRRPLSTGRAASGCVEGGSSNNLLAATAAVGGKRENEVTGPFALDVAEDRKRSESGVLAYLRSTKSAASTPTRRGTSVGPLSRAVPVSSESAKESVGTGQAPTGAGASGESETPVKKKKTFMEKFGDMLEAAAETAIPATPAAAGNGSLRAKGRRQEWEEWEAETLFEFMQQEARMMADNVRREEVAWTAGDKQRLIALARTWFVPFLSQADFMKQKTSLEKNPAVGTVDEYGRCVSASASSLGRPSASVSAPAPTSASAPASSLFASRKRGPAASGAVTTGPDEGAGGNGGCEGSARGVSEGWGGSSAAGAGGGRAGFGRIRRAVVLGYVVDGYGGDRGGGASDIHYLVEVETAPDEGVSWTCYKRLSDFRGLWTGLSKRYPRLEASQFPQLEGLGFMGRVGGRAAMDERQRQLTAVLGIMLELNPRPQEVVRFLEPHAVGGAVTPCTRALDAARRDAAKSGAGIAAAAGCTACVDLSGVVAPVLHGGGGSVRGKGSSGGARKTRPMRGGRTEVARRAGRSDSPAEAATPLPMTIALRIFLGAVATLQAAAVLQSAGLASRALAASAAALWVLVAGVVALRSALVGRGREDAGDDGGGGVDSPGFDGLRGSGGRILRRASRSPALTECKGPAAASAVSTGKEISPASAAATDEDDRVVEEERLTAWVTRGVMASEIAVAVALIFHRTGTATGYPRIEPLGSFGFGEGSDLAGEAGLVAALAAFAGQHIVGGVAAAATAVGAVVFPPFLAAIATAHVVGSFSPTFAGAGTSVADKNGTWGGSGRSAPDREVSPAAAAALAAAAAAAAPTAEDAMRTRRASSSSAAPDPCLASPVPWRTGSRAGGGGSKGNAARAALGAGAGGMGSSPLPTSEGLPRGPLPAIHPSEAILRLIVAWGGALSLFGGCWMALQPPLALLFWYLGRLFSAVATFPLSRAVDRRTTPGGGGPAMMASERRLRGNKDSLGKQQPQQQQQRGQPAAAPKEQRRSNPLIASSSPLSGFGGAGAASTPGALTSPVTAPSTILLHNLHPTSPLPAQALDVAALGWMKATGRLKEHFKAASRAVKVAASKWRYSLSGKVKRWRVSLANKIMPKAAREGDRRTGGSGEGSGTCRPPFAALEVEPALAEPPVPSALTRPATALQPSPLPPPPTAPEMVSSPPAEQQQHPGPSFVWKRMRDSSGDGGREQQPGDWLSRADCAFASVYGGGHELTHVPRGYSAVGFGTGIRTDTSTDGGVCAHVERQRGYILSAAGGGGSGGDGYAAAAGGIPARVLGTARRAAFVSTAEVLLLWVVVVGVWAAMRVEYRLARERRWKELASLVIGKAVVAGSILVVPSLYLWGGGPALPLCMVEVCRSVAVLALTSAVVRAGIKPDTSGRGGRGVRAHSRRRKSRPRLKDDPTTPRGEHLAQLVAFPLPLAPDGGDTASGGGGVLRSHDASPPAAVSERISRKASLTPSLQQRSAAGGGGSGGWFSGDSWHSSNSGIEGRKPFAEKKQSSLSRQNSDRGNNTNNINTSTAYPAALSTAFTTSKKNRDNTTNSNTSGGGGGGDQAQSAVSNVSRFLSELSNSIHGATDGSSGGVKGRSSRGRSRRKMHPGWDGKGSPSSSSSSAAAAAAVARRSRSRGDATSRSALRTGNGGGGEVKPAGWVWGDDNAE